MRVAVIDIGSNTARLLVAAKRGPDVRPIREERAYLGLGAEIVRHGAVPEHKLAEAAAISRRYAGVARKSGATRIEVLVTAPGRQGRDPERLVEALARAAGVSVRVLSAEEEGELAYRGATAGADPRSGTVAVCDIGGGSTEIAVGIPPAPPSWLRSLDLGALRLTAQTLPSDPPTSAELGEAQAAAERCLADVVPPMPQTAYAVGGSARALTKVAGKRTLGERELTQALELVSARRAAKIAKAYGLDEERARVLPAGAIILRAVALRLGVPLELGRGGLREGAAASLLAELAAA